MGARDLRTYLRGTWQLGRMIEDRRAGQTGSFIGQAVFEDDENGGLRYEETGTLRIGGHEGPASRVYLYRFPHDLGIAEVFFDDGRAFHVLDLRDGIWEGEHLCGPDIYNGLVEVIAVNQWTSRWVVTGPRKDLTMETEYRRSSS